MTVTAEIPTSSVPSGTKSPEFNAESREELIRLLQTKPQAQFSSFLLYDAKGSDLYEKITTTPEYYIARAEKAVINQHLANFAPWSKSERHVLVELGSGVGEKTHDLLPVVKAAAPDGNFLYAPLDFDAWALKENKERLAGLYPDIKCQTVQGLFEEALPEAVALEGRKTILFQGSTFGNFKSYKEAVGFMELVGGLMQEGDRFVIGVDTGPIEGKKSAEYVHDCYRKDTNGWRTEFMMNGMDHANRRCGLNLNRNQFKRVTKWDAEECCVFHYYECTEACTVSTVEGEEVRSFSVGEQILVQTHYKFNPDKIARMAIEAGLVMSRTYMTDNQHFLWAELTVDPTRKMAASVDSINLRGLKEDNSSDTSDIDSESDMELMKSQSMDLEAAAAKAKDRETTVSMLKQNKFHTMYFYDAKGSQLYENITKQPEYYLTKTEAALIKDKAHEIAPWGTTRHIMVELGAGVGEKTHRLLPAMKAGSPKGNFLYAPVDCDGWCLETNAERLSKLHPDIECAIQVGLYEDMLMKIKDMEGQKTILFLGSTICNFNSDDEAVSFVAMIKACMQEGDRLIVGVDTPPKEGKKSVDYVHDAYRKSTGGHREEFIMNGLDHCKRRSGVDLDRQKWKRVTVWNAEVSAVQHFIESKEDQDVLTIPEKEVVKSFKKGDRVLVSTHSKFSGERLQKITEAAGLKVTRNWMPDNEHWLWQESVIAK